MDWKENNQELIVVLLTFDTDEKGGDGGVNPNATSVSYTHLTLPTIQL